MFWKKREEKGKEKRRCFYLDLQLGRNSRRLSSYDDTKRIEKKKHERTEEDRGQREADAEDCIGNVWEKIGEGYLDC